MNITDPIRVFARERPDALALSRRDGRSSTYADLDRRIDGLAQRLVTLGVGPGDVAIVAVGAPIRGFWLSLALARIGAAAATWTFPADRAAACLVSRGEPGPGHPRTIVVEREWFSEPAPAGSAITPSTDASAVALICVAMSSDGERRFVPLTHAMIAARIAAAERALPSTANDRQWTLLPKDAAAARQSGVNRLAAQPNSLAALLAASAQGERFLPALERIEVSGGDIPAKLLARAREGLGGEIHSLYRTTQCGPVAAARIDALDCARGEVGIVLPGVAVVAVDEAGSPLPPGVEGRLRVEGAGVAASFGADSLSGVGAGTGSCLTYDRGTVTADGKVRLVASTGDVINAGGNRVHLGRLEETIASLSWVGDAAVFGIPDSHGLLQVGAAIVPTGRPLPEDFAKLGIRHDTHSPTVLMQVREIPRDAAGAPRRDELVAMAIANQQKRTDNTLH